MSKEQRYTYYIDEFDEFDWAITDNTIDESYEYLEDIAKVLNEQADKIADLETKLAESEKLNKRLEQIVDKLRDKEFAGKHLVEAVNAVYEPLYQNKYDEAEQLKQKLKEKDQAIESLQEINQSLGQTCNNDAKEIERLREELAEKEKEVEYQESMKILAVKNQNQTAIAELEKVRNCFGDYLKGLLWNDTMLVGKVCNMINEIFDQQIKLLKGEK